MKKQIKPVAFLATLFLGALGLSGNAFAGSSPFIARHGIDFSTGNKYISEHEITLASPVTDLGFSRNYNSQSTEKSAFGYGWSLSGNETLLVETDQSSITYTRSDGHVLDFYSSGAGQWTNEVGKKATIVKVASGYELRFPDGRIKTFNATGNIVSSKDANGNQISYTYTATQLTGIADAFGHSLTLQYNADGTVKSLTTPFGQFTYTYDANGNLTYVTNPLGKQRKYLYQDVNDPHNLTGIVDETYQRVLTVEYDAIDRVTSSAFANGQEKVTIAYQPGYKRVVTDALGVASTYQLAVRQGVAKVVSFTGPGCAACGENGGTSYAYDSRNQVTSITDAKGTVTTYTYDATGNRLTETKAAGTTLAQTTTFTYTPQNKVATITEPSVAYSGQKKVTSMTYNASGNLLTQTTRGYNGANAISKTTTFTYDTLGRITSVNGPLTAVNDIQTLTYYPNEATQGANRGQLYTVTNALGQVTTYSNYAALGKPGAITDSNGQVSRFSYNFRGQVLSRTMGSLTTSFTYDAAGRLQKVTKPNTGDITYTYTGDQVTTITDSLGNQISYTYDAKGQRTGQDVRDPAKVLTSSLRQAYDTFGKLSKNTYPDGAVESYSYDAKGNLISILDPNSTRTDLARDALDRLQRITVAGATTATYAYDKHNNITTVTDARGKATSFIHDDFGNTRTTTAPDTGKTVATYDTAGNLLTLTGARNQAITFGYDALSRPISQSYPGAVRKILFIYDKGAIGKLGSIQEEESTRSFTYNSLGQLTKETRILGGITANTSYSYNSTTGNMESMTYPSGRVLSFTRDAAGQITGLGLDGTPLLASGTYLPSGPLNKVSLGSVALTRSYDQRYQLSRIQAAGLDYTYTRDRAGQVTGIAGVPIPSTTASTETDTYSTVNNRLTGVSNGAATKTYTYDAAGNIISDGTYAYNWDALNRLVKVTKAGVVQATYAYDSQNRRIRKTVGTKVVHYHYSRDNLLIGESLANGTPLRDYFYLNNEPVAMKEYEKNPGLYYFINDNLGTPQQLVTSTGTVVWKAAYLPYGGVQIQISTVTNNLRFPGQYYDAETGLHYNWNRYYNPSTGRYLSPDPIGLRGGMNLYRYVKNNPINLIDPWGLADLNLLPPNSNAYNYAEKSPQTDHYSVSAHGSPTRIVDQNGLPIPPKDLADMISKDPKYKPGTPVDLMACQTGKNPDGGGEPYAKKLAKELGVEVNAPNTYYFLYSDGTGKPFEAQNGDPHTPDLTKPGQILTFRP